jgi:hypothetical protein
MSAVVVVSADETTVASGGSDGAVVVWQKGWGASVFLANAAVTRLGVVADGRLLAAGLKNGEVLVLELVGPMAVAGK